MALKPCPECNKSISTEAKVCPNCGKKGPNRKPVSCLGVLLLLLILGPIVIIGISANSHEQAVPKKRDFGFIDKEGALTLCVDQLQKMAKYPSSVEFVSGDYQVYQEKKGDVIVVENFTAMNSFGARLPHQGICRLRKNGTVKVHITDR